MISRHNVKFLKSKQEIEKKRQLMKAQVWHTINLLEIESSAHMQIILY